MRSSAEAQSPFSATAESAVKGGSQLKGLVSPRGRRQARRPSDSSSGCPAKWNGSLVIGAHGGSGGDAIDRSGKVYGTSETALDDVIGDYAFANGFAYASVDRDGIGGTRRGLRVDDAVCDAGERRK